MFGLVRIALTRPYTFVVLALLILIVGPLAALRTPTDIFPEIRIPVIAVIWQYTGLSPDQMAGRITSPFQPGVNIATANAQLTSVSQFMLRNLPPGTVPPLILSYSASTVPIVQLAL